MRLWIRADAAPAVGVGHVMRTMAVAEQATASGIEVTYVTAAGSVGADLVAQRGYRVTAAGPDRRWRREIRTGDAVLFDGYHFGPVDFAEVAAAGARVAAIDDLGRGHFPVDVLLNQNPVSEPQYRTRRDTLLLLGPRHALIRQEFRDASAHARAGDAHTLVLTFGGSDPAGAGAVALAAMPQRRAFPDVVFVRGPANADIDLATPPGVRDVDPPPSMAQIFAAADAAVAAAGSTTWELLAMGVPCALVETAANQRLIGPAVADAGAAIYLGDVAHFGPRLLEALDLLADARRRTAMSAAGRRLVDGRGSERLLAALVG